MFKFLKLKHLLFLFLILQAFDASAQKEARRWYFGTHAGLDFSNYFPRPVADGEVVTEEGVASVCDTTGNLLFYTDGTRIWDKNHRVMPGGESLNGDPTSSDAATIVPSPVDPVKYYVFTTRSWNPEDPDNFGGNYYIVDFSEDPDGRVVYDNSAVTGEAGILPNSTEKLLAIPVLGEQAYWILMHQFNSNTFALFKLDTTLHAVGTQNIGMSHENGENDDGKNRGASGQIKVSLQGTRIAVAVEGQKHIDLFWFNPQTGELSRHLKIPVPDPDDKFTARYQPYGVEFSPSGQFVYGTTREGGMVYRWDISAWGVDAIAKSVLFLNNNPAINCGEAQLAPNGKIYIAFNEQDYLGVINNPSSENECDFQANGARLVDNATGQGGRCRYGLPATVPVRRPAEPFYFRNTCLGETTYFYITNPMWQWTATYRITEVSTGQYKIIQGNTTSGTSTPYVFENPGEYTVVLTILKSGVPNRYTRTVHINAPPVVNLASQDRTVFCKGSSLPLDAGIGAFYEWEDVTIRERFRTIVDSLVPQLLNEFRVKVTDYNTCVGWDTLWLEPKNPPKVESVNIVPVFCNELNGGATVIPEGNLGNFLFRWDHDSTLTGNSVSGMAAGVYPVHITSKSTGCENYLEIEILKIGNGDVQIVAESQIPACPGAPLVLRAENCHSIEWLNPSGDTTREITVYPVGDTVFKVKGITRDAGRECPTFAEFPVTVVSTVRPDLGDDRLECEGVPIVLDGGKGFQEWNWSNGMTGQVITLDEGGGDIILFASDSNHCITTDTVNVRFIPEPELTIATTKALCGQSNGSVTVTPAEGEIDDYLFVWENFPGLTGNVLSGVKGGTYRIRVISKASNCETSAEIVVDELGARQVEITASSADTLCPGTALLLTASNSDKFEWINPPGITTAEITVRPLQETVYMVRGITIDDEGNQCSAEAEITIPVHPVNKPDLGGEISSCIGEVLEVDGHSGYLEWSWSNGMRGRFIELQETYDTLILSVIDQNRCEFRDTVNIIFNPLPLVNLGEDKTLCTNQPVVLSGGDGEEWLWSTGETTSEIPVNTSGLYILEITLKGCTNSDSVNVQIYNPNNFTIYPSDVKDITCFGANNGSLMVIAAGPAQSFLYSIDDGATFLDNGGLFTDLPPGDSYLLQVMTDGVCRIGYDTPIVITEPDDIRIRHRIRLASCKDCRDGILELEEISGGTAPYTVTWSNNQTGSRIENLEPGSYTATVTDQQDCIKTFDFELVVKTDIPNAFTPNGDGVNDRWAIKFLDFYPEAIVRIFDSFGKMVFSAENGYPDPWDGTSEGIALPIGTYYYFVQLSAREAPMTGSLTLLR